MSRVKAICKTNEFKSPRMMIYGGGGKPAIYKHLKVGETYEFEINAGEYVNNYTLINTNHKETNFLNSYRFGLDFRLQVKARNGGLIVTEEECYDFNRFFKIIE